MKGSVDVVWNPIFLWYPRIPLAFNGFQWIFRNKVIILNYHYGNTMGLGWIRKLSPSSQATIHHHSSPFLAQSVTHWACVRVRYWMKLIECWTWALSRRSKRSCSMFQEVGTPCSSPPHGPGRPGNFLHRDGGFPWRHVALCAS